MCACMGRKCVRAPVLQSIHLLWRIVPRDLVLMVLLLLLLPPLPFGLKQERICGWHLAAALSHVAVLACCLVYIKAAADRWGDHLRMIHRPCSSPFVQLCFYFHVVLCCFSLFLFDSHADMLISLPRCASLSSFLFPLSSFSSSLHSALCCPCVICKSARGVKAVGIGGRWTGCSSVSCVAASGLVIALSQHVTPSLLLLLPALLRRRGGLLTHLYSCTLSWQRSKALSLFGEPRGKRRGERSNYVFTMTNLKGLLIA